MVFAPKVSQVFRLRSILPCRLFSSDSQSPSVIKSVAIVGQGLMGHGITQVSASSGKLTQVIAYEPKQEFLDKGKSRIENSIAKLVSKGRMTQEDANRTLGSIHFTTDMNALSNVDMIVEAIIENIDLKKSLYKDLNRVCKNDTIFASNTSSLSITDMAEISGRKEKFVGLHFFNPVQMMKLVEVIHTKYTDPLVFDKVFHWAGKEGIGKVAVKCGDTPGFIVNRLLMPYLIQAMLMVDRKDATVQDIDTSMLLGAGHPMGPLHLADYIGLDTCYYIVQGWVEKYPDESSFVLPQCLAEKVKAGELGRKTGKGFYYWDGEKVGKAVN